MDYLYLNIPNCCVICASCGAFITPIELGCYLTVEIPGDRGNPPALRMLHQASEREIKMLQVGDVLELGPLGMKFYINKTAAETNGQSFEMDLELDPQTDAGIIHIHPHAVESYEVLQGKFDVYINGDWKTLSVGEKAVVENSVPHTFRNTGNERTRVYNIHQPAMRFDQFFEGLYKLANSGVSNSRHRRPRTFKTLLLISVLYTSYKDEIQSVRPPYALMQVLGFVGRLLGYRV